MRLGHLRAVEPVGHILKPRMDVTAVPPESDEDEQGGAGAQSSGDAEQHPDGGDGKLVWTGGHFASLALRSTSHVSLLIGRIVDANVGKRRRRSTHPLVLPR